MSRPPRRRRGRNVTIVNNIVVKGAAPSGTGSCGDLQTDITAALKTPITFETDGFTLTAATRQELSAVAEKLKACPDAKVAIVGHTTTPATTPSTTR